MRDRTRPRSDLYLLSQSTSGRGAVWLAHLLWEQGVGGSNPLAPTFLSATSEGPIGWGTSGLASSLNVALRSVKGPAVETAANLSQLLLRSKLEMMASTVVFGPN